jgi:exopolysaccharide biosynthesis protein
MRTNAVKDINRMFLLAAAPFLGIMLWLLAVQLSVQLPRLTASMNTAFSIQNEAKNVESRLELATTDAVQTKSIIQSYFKLYEQTSAEAASLLTNATAQAAIPNAIFDQRISAKLGNPNRQAGSGNIDVKLYALNEASYKGYAMKVNMKSDKAVKLVLGNDKLGSSETTLNAAQRYGALAGVNAGGFADDARGRRFPLDTTILNGNYVNGFFPSNNETIFIGLSKDRKLIGGKFNSQSELDKLGPLLGSTFVPTLLKNGQKLSIPAKWQSSPARAARTIIGNYKNDQLLFLVTDGHDESGNSGATLAEIQDKLVQLGVQDAYNLDGGGSSTLVFDGSLVNHPSDGKLRPLATNFLFFK